MPQLDTIYIFMIHAWTWLILLLISQKIKTLRITAGPKNQQQTKPDKPTLTLPWT